MITRNKATEIASMIKEMIDEAISYSQHNSNDTWMGPLVTAEEKLVDLLSDEPKPKDPMFDEEEEEEEEEEEAEEDPEDSPFNRMIQRESTPKRDPYLDGIMKRKTKRLK